jgi:hypothetical protein
MPNLPLPATAVAAILLSFATGTVAQMVPSGTAAPKVPPDPALMTKPKRGRSAISTLSTRMVLPPTSPEILQ